MSRRDLQMLKSSGKSGSAGWACSLVRGIFARLQTRSQVVSFDIGITYITPQQIINVR